MLFGILLAIIANLDNNPPRLISSTCLDVVFHIVPGYIMPLAVVACLFLFHLVSSPTCTRL